MPAIGAYAPGKCILLGEHAVVYHRPAIAIPVQQVQAHAVVVARPTANPGDIRIEAPDIDLESDLDDLPRDHPITLAIHGAIRALGITVPPAFLLRVTSTIPLAAGLGSSAAVSVAMIRAVTTFLGNPLPPDHVSSLAYEVEKKQHGTPSGIDNTVIAFAKPIFFQRDQPFQILKVAEPLTLIIADSGYQSSTAEVVADVRQNWQKNPAHYEAIFDAIAALVNQARFVLENGPVAALGNLMNVNHEYLREIKVSNPELDHLVQTALNNGALGAKLSGGGRGGNIIALGTPDTAQTISQALLDAGAVRTIITTLEPQPE